jgi:hypothetical protein
MATRARTLLIASLVAIPCVAYTCPCDAHNGRDAGPYSRLKAEAAEPDAGPVNIFEGIQVSVDPKTGVRSYVQVGDIPSNNGRPDAKPAATETLGPGVDYWVEKSFQGNGGGLPIAPPQYTASAPQVEMYDEGYNDYGYGYGYGYGGYYPSYGYDRGGGGRHHDRPGHGHGGGGGGDHGSRDRPGGVYMGTPSAFRGSWSPPPGPPGGGVGSPSPYPFDSGVGSRPMPYRGGFRGRRG